MTGPTLVSRSQIAEFMNLDPAVRTTLLLRSLGDSRDFWGKTNWYPMDESPHIFNCWVLFHWNNPSVNIYMRLISSCFPHSWKPTHTLNFQLFSPVHPSCCPPSDAISYSPKTGVVSFVWPLVLQSKVNKKLYCLNFCLLGFPFTIVLQMGHCKQAVTQPQPTCRQHL